MLVFPSPSVYTLHMEEKEDGVLVAEFKRGDTRAYGVLYDRYLDRIYRFIYYKIWNKENAEDITSDVFHKAFQKIDSYDAGKGTFSAWIYRIARNAVIDHYRTVKKTVDIEDAFDLGEEDRTIEEHDTLLNLGRVREFMEKLSPRQREIITLRIWEEFSYREIAEQIGGTEDSAKMAFSRAMKELREKCGPLGLIVLTALLLTEALPFHELS
jgi:RNA polymerase sigma-70 factor, ECF subfamily